MGSVRPELSLDFRPTFVPKTITDFLKEISMIGNVSEKLSKLNGFVKLLEEEMRKIDAFKRELPYCMLLLNDAILVLKEEAIQCAARNAQPVLEEFIPLKKNDNNGDEEGSSVNTKNEKESNSNNKDKKNWMSSVQLWNSDDGFCSDNQKPETKQKNDEDPFQGCKDRGGVREFTPFKAYSVFAPRKEEKELLSVPGLTLLTPGIKNLKEESGSSPLRASSSKAVSSSDPNAQSNVRSGPQPPQQQTARKQRRCWSPELHRRFVNALQQLGGSQVATPKQIRELMQVDGLTNDEVKSHLQKYRLHTRRLPSATTTPAVLGSSLWLSQQQYGESSKGNASHSGSPDGPLQLTANTGGDSMEDEEDAKSESYSWRSHVHKPRKIAV